MTEPESPQSPGASPVPEAPLQRDAEPTAERPTGPTGHPVVDAAVARLGEQAELPPAEQVAGYEAAQRALHQTLASIDEG